jgi:Signal transduction histidine kinase regulating C4-dicarboxylate transport system
MQFDVPTATLVVGFMYLLLPTSVFVFLREHLNPAVWFWCVGGVLNGIGFMTIVLRGSFGEITPSITYTIPNALFFIGLLLRFQSLKMDCKQALSYQQIVLFSAVFIFIYELIWRQVGVDQARNIYLLPVFTIELLLICHTAWVFGKMHQSKVVRVLIYNYFSYASILAIKAIFVAVGDEDIFLLSSSAINITLVLIGFSTVIYTNLGYVGVVLEKVNQERDLSLKENKKLISTLKKKEALISQYARIKAFSDIGGYGSSVIHEISQPLTSANFALENLSTLIAKQKNLPAEILNRLNLVKEPTQKAAQIVNNLRGLMAKSDFNLSPIKLLDRINETLLVLQNKIAQQQISIEVIASDAELQVVADEAQINHVLINILDNAIDATANHTNNKRDIKIKVRSTGHQVYVQVIDSGSGLSSKVQNDMFNWLASNKVGGIGIGLALCKMFVESWGGKITGRNANPSNDQLSGALIELSLLAHSAHAKK